MAAMAAARLNMRVTEGILLDAVKKLALLDLSGCLMRTMILIKGRHVCIYLHPGHGLRQSRCTRFNIVVVIDAASSSSQGLGEEGRILQGEVLESSPPEASRSMQCP